MRALEATLPPNRILALRVRGIVQGVGMRPFVWRLARDLGLRGRVWNDGDGVHIELGGPETAIARFMTALHSTPPPLARIDAVVEMPFPETPLPQGFEIAATGGGKAATLILPDVATCPACLAEVFDRSQRRYGHPFANCTHCGPRFSILKRLPYDRASTSMAAFPLCDHCQKEYEDPADRRFHAQPIACPRCGPRLWLCDSRGKVLGENDPVTAAAARLRAGGILAVKGIGGFHLVVDATDEQAIQRLRDRKRRLHKPLALMARDLEVIGRYRRICGAEAEALQGRAAPIVLLERPGPESLPASLAPQTHALGFMLPMSPLHHLLLAGFDTPLVFTSGNRSGRPQCTGNQEALENLGEVADVFLMHDREIVNRVDDSVLRLVGERTTPLRRGRGLAPAPVRLAGGFAEAPAVLALGGELKNTFCLLRGTEAILSQYIGDLEQPQAWQDWLVQLERLQALFQFEPRQLAVDMHPAYRSSAHGRALGRERGWPVRDVQHHHAHLASVLAEHGFQPDCPPVLGIVLDGLGAGPDGALWGGELLWGGFRRCRRIATLRPAPLPGGAMAMREPWRNLVARLWQEAPALLDDGRFRDKPVAVITRMLEQGVNCPKTSSAGRLFDAVAAFIGIAPERLTYEGQAAMALESLAWQADPACGAYDVRVPGLAAVDGDGQVAVMDPAPLWPAIHADVGAGEDAPVIARRFHHGLADGWARLAREAAGRLHCDTVAVSGGVLQNRLLGERLIASLEQAGLKVLYHRQVPANDGGLALGQACIAAARALCGDPAHDSGLDDNSITETR